MSSTILNSVNSLDYSLEVESDENFGKFTDQLVYEVVKLSECDYDPETETFYYLCPCGDIFEITVEDLLKGKFVFIKIMILGNLISECPSCSLRIRIDLKPGDLDQYVNVKTP